MIIHQTIAPNLDTLLSAKAIKDSKVKLFILITEKNYLAMIAPLDNMMGASRHNNSTYPAHLTIIYARR